MSRTPAMTRGHFILIARTINDMYQNDILNAQQTVALANRFEDAISGTNPNFDRGRFSDMATKDIPANRMVGA